jgi:hypothetical protein
MKSAQVNNVRKNLNSVSKNWAFAGEVAAIGHLRGIGVNKPIKFKEIHVVIPLRKRLKVQSMFFSKGYSASNNSPRHFTVQRLGDKRKVVVYTRAIMPKTVSYDNRNRLVVLNGVPNNPPEIKSLKNFHRTIQNLQNNIN